MKHSNAAWAPQSRDLKGAHHMARVVSRAPTTLAVSSSLDLARSSVEQMWNGDVVWPTWLPASRRELFPIEPLLVKVGGCCVGDMRLADVSVVGADAADEVLRFLDVLSARIEGVRNTENFRAALLSKGALSCFGQQATAMLQGGVSLATRVRCVFRPLKLERESAVVQQNLCERVRRAARELQDEIDRASHRLTWEWGFVIEVCSDFPELQDESRRLQFGLLEANVFLSTLTAKSRQDLAVAELSGSTSSIDVAEQLGSLRTKMSALEARAQAYDLACGQLPPSWQLMNAVLSFVTETVLHSMKDLAGQLTRVKSILSALVDATAPTDQAVAAPNRAVQRRLIFDVEEQVGLLATMVTKAREGCVVEFAKARTVLAKARADLACVSSGPHLSASFISRTSEIPSSGGRLPDVASEQIV